jgi:hypothetical protein
LVKISSGKQDIKETMLMFKSFCVVSIFFGVTHSLAPEWKEFTDKKNSDVSSRVRDNIAIFREFFNHIEVASIHHVATYV